MPFKHGLKIMWNGFLSGSGSTGKSHLAKEVSNVISKSLLYHRKNPEKPKVLSLWPTGIPAVKIDQTIINSGLEVALGTNILGLNDK